MSGWIAAGVLVVLSLVALWRIGRVSGSTLQLAGAAAMLAMAGYAWQGSPALIGRPTPPKGEQAQPDSAFAQLRGTMMERQGGNAQVLDSADALHRQGLDPYAIAILRGAISRNPDSSDLWLGMANALTEYSDGIVTPAAKFAFDRAERLAPDAPAPAFFHALALAQSGQIDQAAAIWRALLARTPVEAPWRPQIAAALAIAEGRVPER